MSPIKKADSNEKRRFFRIDDYLYITCEKVDEEAFREAANRVVSGQSEQFLLISDLAAITSEMSVYLRKIESTDPDLSMYLKGLDKKIDLIGRAVMSEQLGINNSTVNAVNISASGMAIMMQQERMPGDKLEIRIVLLPDNAGLLAFGEVINCEKHQDGYLIRVDFTYMRDEDRDLLIRHIMRKQGEMLRERRVSKENQSD